MTDLVARLREAIDETERIAQAALRHPTKYDPATQEELPNGTDDGVWKTDGCDVESANVPWGGGIRIYDEGGHDEEQAEHIARHDPAAVLRRCAADRQILDLYVGTVEVRDIAWDEYRAGRMPTHVKARDADDAQRELAALQVVLEALAEAYSVEA